MAAMTVATRPSVHEFRLDGGTQPRAEINVFTVQEYADAMRDGASFPPVTVFYDGTDYWLADGFHRVAAAKEAGIELASDIRQGSRREAVLHSVGANATHGLRRTNDDKRRAVIVLLEDEEWRRWSDREIARRAGVSNDFVSRFRKSLSSDDSEERAYVDRYGNERTMNTANIGGTIRTDTRQALNDYPDHISQTAYKAALATVDGQHHSVTPKMAVQHADNLLEGERTGFFDGGYDGESKPVTEPGSWVGTRDATERERRMRQKAHLNVLSDDSVEWYTPPEYVEAAREVMGGIDLDPASNPTAQELISATTFYTKETDGLAHDWRGRVWLNPPWGRACAEFVAKALHHFDHGEVTEAVLLLNSNSNDAGWFQPLFDHTLCFTRGRIDYYTTEGERKSGSTHGSVFAYLGPDWRRFATRFSDFGNVVRRVIP